MRCSLKRRSHWLGELLGVASLRCSSPPATRTSSHSSIDLTTKAEAVCPPCSSASEGLVEGVAGAANGADRIALLAARQRLTQATDMDIDGPLVDLR